LRIERLTPEAVESLVPEWAALDAELSPRTPFSSPAWNLLWWRHFGGRSLAVRDQFFSHVVRDDTGRLIAVAPMVITHRPGVGPLGVRTLQFFGADANITELRGMVCRAEHQSQVLSALSGHFLSRASDWDWLHWHGIRGDESAWNSLANGAQVLRGDCIPDYCLTLPATWEAFRAGLSRNIKESVRKCYNSLKRDGHAFVFRAVSRPEEARAAIARFFDLHAARASVTDTINHPDVFGGQRARAFLSDFAQHAAEEGTLRVFQLEIAGVVVATRVGFALGNELYLYFSGYDDAWGKYSVMTTVVAEAIKWAIENGFKVINLSPGNDVSKLRWGPTEIPFRHGVQLSPTRRGRVVFRAYCAVVDRGQSAPRLAPLLRALRRRP
jgi:CelD/BcsL family acetyltransferase involved in cellulose biosynthesis